MPAATDRLEFAPPVPQGLLRGVLLALLAHGALLAALTWGVSWKHQAQTATVEAELWASVAQPAAPKLIAPPPEPEVIPIPPKVEPTVSNADIAIEREKERKAAEKLAQEKLEKEKVALAKKQLEEERKKKELEAKAKQKLIEQATEKAIAELRQDNLQRMAGLAGASGSTSATGSAKQSAGPATSKGYGLRIVARIKPNIVFTDDIGGNPEAEVEVRTSPDGTIVARRLLKSSGIKAWDEAVLKAIDKTEVLPRDVDGRVPSPIIISFRPRD